MRVTNILRLKLNNIKLSNTTQFVPKHDPVPEKYIKALEDFLISRPKMLVLTGAGISTESGIPDYRSEGVGLYARSNSRPVQHIDFLRSPAVRKRYWARNFIGWPRFSQIQPNATHHALARFESEGRIQGIVTQNVDRLHTKAGSKNVIEIHGSGYTVKCLLCDYRVPRHDFQETLKSMNTHMSDTTQMMRPDGDVDIPQEEIDGFRIPNCPDCGGNLKPEIVFFGDNVPRDRIEKIREMVSNSDGLLVLGSSLLVFSGYRLVLQTNELELPVVIVNIGPTRGDHLATIKMSAKCGDVIPKLFNFS